MLGDVSVCPGDELSFTCNTSANIQEWRISYPNGSRSFTISDVAPNTLQEEYLDAKTIIHTLKISTNPLVSMLNATNLTRPEFDGTMILCTPITGPIKVSPTVNTTIHVTKADLGIM